MFLRATERLLVTTKIYMWRKDNYSLTNIAKILFVNIQVQTVFNNTKGNHMIWNRKYLRILHQFLHILSVTLCFSNLTFILVSILFNSVREWFVETIFYDKT